MRFAFLSQGKLFVSRPGAAPALIDSTFGQELRETHQRIQQKNQWKRNSSGAQFAAWGGGANFDPASVPVQISGITGGGKASSLVYALNTDTFGGLFSYDLEEKTELRLFHKNDFSLHEVHRHPVDSTTYACCREYRDGSARIAVSESEGRRLSDVTEGDSRDESPAWIPGRERSLLFQSAGMGRNQNGDLVGLGPYSIQSLDLVSGRHETLLEDDRIDYLSPRMDEAGNLYCIRRPYEDPTQRRASFSTFMLDIICFPYRFLRAIFCFFDVFSKLFTGKALANSRQAPGGTRNADLKRMVLYGRLLDVEKAQQSKQGAPGEQSLVPKTWELIRVSPDGKKDVIDSGVMSFDLLPGGALLICNGSAISTLSKDGSREVLHRDKLITKVVSL